MVPIFLSNWWFIPYKISTLLNVATLQFLIPTYQGVRTIFNFLRFSNQIVFLQNISTSHKFRVWNRYDHPRLCLLTSTLAIWKLFIVFRSSANEILVDVFFQKSTCFLYQTDIVFDFMNALGEWRYINARVTINKFVVINVYWVIQILDRIMFTKRGEIIDKDYDLQNLSQSKVFKDLRKSQRPPTHLLPTNSSKIHAPRQSPRVMVCS